VKDNQSPVAYKTRHERLPAFELVGFTKIVKSGGELYSEARQDGRWDVLRTLAGEDGTVYGVASRDEECTKGHYRYTLAVKAAADKLEESSLRDSLFSIQIREAEWIFFAIEDFEAQYGRLWRDDPYKMIAKLGWAYNSEVGLHIDVFPPSYSAESDSMEFMMPVSKPA
jgi:hypothetical protein